MAFDFPDRWSAEKIDVIDATDSIGKIFKLSNVSYKTGVESETIHFPGKTFIAFSELWIWHYLYDNLAQFEYLKTQIPDLKMRMFCPTSFSGGTIDSFLEECKRMNFHVLSDTELDVQPHKYLVDTFKIFVDQEDIFDIYSKNMTFDEVYFVIDQQRLFNTVLAEYNERFWFGVRHAYWIKDDYEGVAHRTRDLFMDSWWREIGILSMREKLLKELNKINTQTPKKIFLSRKDANERYAKTLNPAVVAIHDRVIKKETDDLIEDYFIQKGYTPVLLEGMGYLEQLKYFQNADSIAGLIGSSFCQTLVCDPKCCVSEILINKRYDFTYRFISDNVGYKLARLDLRKIVDEPDKIIEQLEKHYGYTQVIEKFKNG